MGQCFDFGREEERGGRGESRWRAGVFDGSHYEKINEYLLHHMM